MTAVKLNIYELIQGDAKSHTLSNDALAIVGMGIYHSGLEVYGQEISFGMDPTGKNDPNTDGVFIVSPMSACGKFKESIELGNISQDEASVQAILQKLRPEWRAAGYHMLGHNCNCFTKAFAEALDVKLLDKYPSWVNRAGTGANVVAPDALLKSITDAIAPPTAAAPELINKIHVSYNGDCPKPLSSAATASTSGGGGMFGAVKGFASKAAAVVNEKTVSIAGKSAFNKEFPELSSENLLDKFSVTVIHINRMQTATLYVTDKGIAFGGANQLHLAIKYNEVVSLQFGTKIDGNTKNLPPTFAVQGDSSKADAFLIYLNAKGCMIPVYKGGVLPGAIGLANDMMKAISIPWKG